MANDAASIRSAAAVPPAPYQLIEAIVGQGGVRAILMIETATGVCVEAFANGHEQPNAETWAEARGYMRGVLAERDANRLVSEICGER